MTVPALFKRKSNDRDDTATTDTEEVAAESAVTEVEPTRAVRDKTAPTPKRQAPKKKRPPKNPPLTHKEARERAKLNQGPKPDKNARRAAADERRAERIRVTEGQDRGDPMFDKYHMPRDKGPERLLVRDIVDARRNIGQYFFIIAIIIMLASSPSLPPVVQQASLIGWVLILVAFVIDSILLCRRVLRVVNKRYPKHTQRKAGMCWYAISRSIMFRKLRMPRPRPGIEPGTPEKDLGKVFRA